MAEVRKYGVALADGLSTGGSAPIVLPLRKAADGKLDQNTYVYEVGDIKIRKDGQAAVNLPAGTAPTFTQGCWQLALLAPEMSARVIVLILRDVNAPSIEEELIVIETFGAAGASYPDDYGRSMIGTPVGASIAVDVAAVKSDTTATLTAVDTEVAAIKLKTDTLPANPAAVGSAMTLAADAITASTLALDGAQEIAGAVWDEPLAPHAQSGSAGQALGAAGTSSDPWIANLPGPYSGSQAGKIVGDNLNAAVGSRAAAGAAMALTPGERDALIDGIWNELLTGHTFAGSTGRALQLARAQAKGRWERNGSQLDLYDVDNTTLLASFALTPTEGPFAARAATPE